MNHGLSDPNPDGHELVVEGLAWLYESNRHLGVVFLDHTGNLFHLALCQLKHVGDKRTSHLFLDLLVWQFQNKIYRLGSFVDDLLGENVFLALVLEVSLFVALGSALRILGHAVVINGVF